MIAGSLFPTDLTQNATIRGNTYTNEFTKKLSQLGLTDFSTVNGDTNAYFLGWINPYNLPDTLKSVGMAITGTGDNKAVEFVRPNYASNVPFGYMYDVISDGSYGRSIFWKENGGVFQYSYSSNSRLINKFYPEWYSVYPPNIGIELIAATYDPVGTHVRHFAQQHVTLTYDEFKAFESGNYIIHFRPGTIYTGGFQCDFQVTGTDFITGVCSKIDSDGSGYQATIFFSFERITKFTTGTSAGSNSAIIPMIHQTMEFNFSDSSQDVEIEETRAANGGNQAFSHIARISYDNVGITGIYPVSYQTLCWHGCPFANVTVPQDIITDRYAYIYYQNGIIVSQDDLNQNKYVRLYHRIDEVEKFLNLFPRPSQAPSVSYSEGLNYATDVSSNDEFLDDKKTGSIFDDGFRNSLRDWQYIPLDDDGTDEGTGKNDFDPDDPEDMPPYDPNPPEPEPETPDTDPESYTGDLYPPEINPGDHKDEGDVPFNKNVAKYGGSGAFITHYILSANQVKTLGQLLWSTMENAAYLRNYATINEGSNPDAEYYFTNSNILDYFISLRFYPKSATSIFGSSSQGTGIKVGKGVTAYNVGAISAAWNVGYVPAGSVTIPRITNTFVDFEPYTSISLYIPFCGTVELQPSTVMGRLLTLEYLVDISTGACTAYVYTSAMSGDRIPIATVNGTMGFDVLMTGNNAMTVSARAEASNNVTDLNIAQSLTGSVMDSASALISGNKSGDKNTVVGAFKEITGGLINTAFDMAKKNVQQPTLMGLAPMKCGNFISASSLGYKAPFVQIRRHPIFNNGNGYKQVGYISDKEEDIGSLPDGTYFSVINPDLSGINLTEEEKSIIKNYLINGCFK